MKASPAFFFGGDARHFEGLEEFFTPTVHELEDTEAYLDRLYEQLAAECEDPSSNPKTPLWLHWLRPARLTLGSALRPSDFPDDLPTVGPERAPCQRLPSPIPNCLSPTLAKVAVVKERRQLREETRQDRVARGAKSKARERPRPPPPDIHWELERQREVKARWGQIVEEHAEHCAAKAARKDELIEQAKERRESRQSGQSDANRERWLVILKRRQSLKEQEAVREAEADKAYREKCNRVSKEHEGAPDVSKENGALRRSVSRYLYQHNQEKKRAELEEVRKKSEVSAVWPTSLRRKHDFLERVFPDLAPYHPTVLDRDPQGRLQKA